MSGADSILTWLPLLGGLAVKSLIVFLVAGLTLFALRRTSASARHLVCLLTLAALPALPVLSLALPGWRLAVVSVPVSAPPAPNSGGAGRDIVRNERPVGARSITPFSTSAPPPNPVLPHPAPPGLGAGGVRPRPFPWATVLPALWLLGVLLAGLRPGFGLWGIARLSRLSAPVSDASTLALAAECASALRLPRTPALRQAAAPVPMTWGWRRPVVLLAADAQAWPEGRLRAVLLHELAHVRRCDWLSHRFADLVCALYWFHPLAWLTARRLRAEGEIACDDLVLTSGVAAPDYARHLLDVARALRPISAAVPQAAIAMARTARIEGRLRMILDTSRSRRALTRRVLLLALTPGAAALVTLSMLRPAARAQAAPPPRTAQPTVPAAPRTKSSAERPSGKAPAAPMPVVASVPPAPPPVEPPAATSQVTPSALRPLGATPPKTTPRVAQLPPAVSPVPAPPPVSADAPPSLPKLSAGGLLPPPEASARAVFTEDGFTIDFLGMTDADKPAAPWWSASGALLPKAVYDTAAYRAESHAFGGDTRNVIFAFRLPAASEGATVAYKVSGALSSSSEGSWLFKMQGQEHQTEAQSHSRSGGARVLTAAFPTFLTKTNIQIGVASGPWKVATTCGTGALNQGGNIGVRQGSGTFLFSPASETKNGTVVSIATDATDDLRVVAVDAQGKERLPDQPGDNSTGTLDQITARFALPLAQIKEVRVETRAFRWVEFKDIALQPAK